MWLKSAQGDLHNLDYARRLFIHEAMIMDGQGADAGRPLPAEERYAIYAILEGKEQQLGKCKALADAQRDLARVAAALGTGERFLDLSEPAPRKPHSFAVLGDTE